MNAGWITTAGAVTEFPIPTPGSDTCGITAGPDGNLWFTERFGNNIGRITPAGRIAEFPIPTAGSASEGIALGPDGNLWFAETLGDKIGRVSQIPTAVPALSDWGMVILAALFAAGGLHRLGAFARPADA